MCPFQIGFDHFPSLSWLCFLAASAWHASFSNVWFFFLFQLAFYFFSHNCVRRDCFCPFFRSCSNIFMRSSVCFSFQIGTLIIFFQLCFTLLVFQFSSPVVCVVIAFESFQLCFLSHLNAVITSYRLHFVIWIRYLLLHFCCWVPSAVCLLLYFAVIVSCIRIVLYLFPSFNFSYWILVSCAWRSLIRATPAVTIPHTFSSSSHLTCKTNGSVREPNTDAAIQGFTKNNMQHRWEC